MAWRKLTAEEVIVARWLARHEGWSRPRLAKRFNVYPLTMVKAVNGTTWAHLPGAFQGKAEYMPASHVCPYEAEQEDNAG